MGFLTINRLPAKAQRSGFVRKRRRKEAVQGIPTQGMPHEQTLLRQETSIVSARRIHSSGALPCPPTPKEVKDLDLKLAETGSAA